MLKLLKIYEYGRVQNEKLELAKCSLLYYIVTFIYYLKCKIITEIITESMESL